MPANSAEYQRQYRLKNSKRTKEVSVGLPTELHKEFSAFAEKQGLSLASLLRESTSLQIRGSHLRSKKIEEELKELRFLISNIANNVNQMAHHSNQLRQVTDANQVYQRLHELDTLITGFVDTRLRNTS